MGITKGDWEVECVSDAVRVVVGTGRAKVILARLAPKQLPESETTDNARLMALAPRLLQALNAMIEGGLLGGWDHQCTCGNCVVRRLVNQANRYRGSESV